MKLLVFSDIHEEAAALESLRSIAPPYDAVLICGDISQSSVFAESVLESFPKSLIIPGNWDSKRVNGLFSGSAQWLHGKRAELGELNAVGFGYSNHTPFGTFGELSEEDIYERMAKLPIDENTLLMLHCPPKGFFDDVRGRNVGSVSIRRIVEERQPLAAFFGHIHEHRGTATLGRTQLVKLPAAMDMMACSATISNKRITAEFLSLRVVP
ncbi:MAG: metallophosphoesterase family protein [Candidatus Micrarchaeota archaeon]